MRADDDDYCDANVDFAMTFSANVFVGTSFGGGGSTTVDIDGTARVTAN